MSRCFPYPPPGYTRDRSLIESIKIRKEEKAKEQKKKEKRREKKEKRKEKKDKRREKKEKANQDLNAGIGNDQESKTKIEADSKDEFLCKRQEVEAEELEKSSVTEENCPPVCLGARSASSDSTENSNKRKRQPLLVDSSRSHGNFFLVRLPSKKQKDFESLAKEEQPCLTSRTEVAAKNKDDFDIRDELRSLETKRSISQEFALRNDRKQDCSTSGQVEAVASGKTSTKERVELLHYKNLIENWVPPQLQDVCLYPDDSDWLCEDSSRVEKRVRCANDSLSCSRESALWPRAEYLHDVGVHALPFTIPF